jgi:hypothetical protein
LAPSVIGTHPASLALIQHPPSVIGTHPVSLAHALEDALQATGGAPVLKQLRLRFDLNDDAGAHALADALLAGGAPPLAVLDPHRNQITDKVRNALTEALEGRCVTECDASHKLRLDVMW